MGHRHLTENDLKEQKGLSEASSTVLFLHFLGHVKHHSDDRNFQSRQKLLSMTERQKLSLGLGQELFFPLEQCGTSWLHTQDSRVVKVWHVNRGKNELAMDDYPLKRVERLIRKFYQPHVQLSLQFKELPFY
jgi:hypothetical protein